MSQFFHTLDDRQKEKLKELAIKFRWNPDEQKFHEECARTTLYNEYPFETSCGCSGSPHCGCEDSHYCHETQQYCWYEWEEVWDAKQQKVVEVEVDIRNKPEPVFRGFAFSFCDENGVNWEEGKEKSRLIRMFRPPQTPIEFYFDNEV